MLRRTLATLCAASLAAAPAAAQPVDPPAETRERSGLEGEAIGYLALPVLLVLILVVGLLVGGGDEQPESP